MPQPQNEEEMPPFPNNIGKCIKKYGYFVQDVADEISISRRTLSNYIAGERAAPRDILEKIAKTLGCEIEELTLQSRYTSRRSEASDTQKEVSSATESDENEVNRREASKKIASTLGKAFLITSPDLVGLPLLQRLSRVLEKSSHVDDTALSGLEKIAKDYWNLRTNLGYRNLLHGFSGHLETVIQLLQGSQSPASRKRLCTIASEIMQRIGAIYFDMNDYATAREYYNVSIQTAQEAENYTSWATGLVRMSFLPIYSKSPQDALPLLLTARKLVEPHGASAILAWIASMEAEAYANLHDEHACLQVLGQVERFMERSKNGEDHLEIKFDYARFVGYKGVCHLRLRQAEAALSALNEGVTAVGTLSARQKSIIVADSAAAYTQQGEIDEACRLAIQALAITDQTKSLLASQRILDVRREMNQWKTSQPVKEFDTQLVLRGIFPS